MAFQHGASCAPPRTDLLSKPDIPAQRCRLVQASRPPGMALLHGASRAPSRMTSCQRRASMPGGAPCCQRPCETGMALRHGASCASSRVDLLSCNHRPSVVDQAIRARIRRARPESTRSVGGGGIPAWRLPAPYPNPTPCHSPAIRDRRSNTLSVIDGCKASTGQSRVTIGIGRQNYSTRSRHQHRRRQARAPPMENTLMVDLVAWLLSVTKALKDGIPGLADDDFGLGSGDPVRREPT